MYRIFACLLISALHFAVARSEAQTTFGRDVAFLRRNVGVVLLKRGDSQVAVVPQYQCRVMTSTVSGSAGASFGWVNRDLIASHTLQPHINVFGGEDRFWLGPEGGQFSLFFKKGATFDLAHWQTPAPIDSQPFEVESKSADSIVCRRKIQLTNYSGATFDLTVTRKVVLRDPAGVLKYIGVEMPRAVKAVAFSTVNAIRNDGQTAWTKETGLLSIWILGMYNASTTATIVVPYKVGREGDPSAPIHDAYFGKVPPTRLKDDDGVLYFRADARYRSKIGVPPQRARNILGSYDSASHTLTLITYSLPENSTAYVNSLWEIQQDPFGGDVTNAYSDGPPAPGARQLGKFYELETSSPALALAPGQSATHEQTTLHLQGSPQDLDGIAVAVLGRGLERISHALPQ